MRRKGGFPGDGLRSWELAVKPKRSRLPALTGLRSFAALNLVFFHYSNPQWFGWFAPIVNSGYISVSFFLLLSGFILTYNYAERGAKGELGAARFWKARLSRLYPVYLFTLLISVGMLMEEYHSQTPGMFAAGLVLTPLLLQGWHPVLATFWNTPAWTLSTEVFFYALFPFLIRRPAPRSTRWLAVLLAVFWIAGMLSPALYMYFHPDGDLHPGRYTTGVWMRALKFTPLPHLPSFLFGMALGALNERIPMRGWTRMLLGAAGFSAIYCVLYYGDHMPYPLMHDGLLMPLFGALILGLAGENPLSRIFGFRLFVMVGEASYCLYLLHFNLWTLIHESGLLERLRLAAFDPWISYLLLVLGAMATLFFVERPGQRWLKRVLEV